MIAQPAPPTDLYPSPLGNYLQFATEVHGPMSCFDHKDRQLPGNVAAGF
jgi:hypothetical protein